MNTLKSTALLLLALYAFQAAAATPLNPQEDIVPEPTFETQEDSIVHEGNLAQEATSPLPSSDDAVMVEVTWTKDKYNKIKAMEKGPEKRAAEKAFNKEMKAEQKKISAMPQGQEKEAAKAHYIKNGAKEGFTRRRRRRLTPEEKVKKKIKAMPQGQEKEAAEAKFAAKKSELRAKKAALTRRRRRRATDEETQRKAEKKKRMRMCMKALGESGCVYSRKHCCNIWKRGKNYCRLSGLCAIDVVIKRCAAPMYADRWKCDMKVTVCDGCVDNRCPYYRNYCGKGRRRRGRPYPGDAACAKDGPNVHNQCRMSCGRSDLCNFPTPAPTPRPTRNPTTAPTPRPTTNPTTAPTRMPTTSPTRSPTRKGLKKRLKGLIRRFRRRRGKKRKGKELQ